MQLRHVLPCYEKSCCELHLISRVYPQVLEAAEAKQPETGETAAEHSEERRERPDTVAICGNVSLACEMSVRKVFCKHA